MAEEHNTNNHGSGLNRRSFIKSAGVAIAGGTLGAGLTTLVPEAAAATAPRREHGS